MSGICTLLRLDGGVASRQSLTTVLAGMAARGPDGAAILSDGPVALGHALLITTPEALSELLPLRHGPTGCVITADVRLDNRAELMAALGLDQVGRVIGDGELICAAYGKWGLDCPAHLLGDFAFVLWDPCRQRLLAARDKVGMRQLVYHYNPGRLFACATDADALIAHPQVPRRINEARIADFLEQLEAIDHVSTFYQDVLRLPPAHALVVERGLLRQWRYWQLAPIAVIHRARDADYEAAFLEVFTRAVSSRLRSVGPVGSMLSGGMDSGAVTAVAARLLREAGASPLATFSGIDIDPACKETACIRAASTSIDHIAPSFASLGDPISFLEEVSRLTQSESDPFDGHMALIRAIYGSAHRAGIKVMLDGVAGDSTLSTGDMISYHLRHGRLKTAWAEARAQERIWGAKAKASTAFQTAARRTLLRALLPTSWQQRREKWKQSKAKWAHPQSLVRHDLAERVDMPVRRRTHAAHVALNDDCDLQAHAQRMLHPYIIVGRERYDRVAGAIGIEPRDPYLDVRVLEFCLTLPPEQLQGNGWTKMILRKAMYGMLPDLVRWKAGRDHVGWRFSEICTEKPLNALDDETYSRLCRYAAIETDRRKFALLNNSNILLSECDLHYLAMWLKQLPDL